VDRERRGAQKKRTRNREKKVVLQRRSSFFTLLLMLFISAVCPHNKLEKHEGKKEAGAVKSRPAKFYALTCKVLHAN